MGGSEEGGVGRRVGARQAGQGWCCGGGGACRVDWQVAAAILHWTACGIGLLEARGPCSGEDIACVAAEIAAGWGLVGSAHRRQRHCCRGIGTRNAWIKGLCHSRGAYVCDLVEAHIGADAVAAEARDGLYCSLRAVVALGAEDGAGVCAAREKVVACHRPALEVGRGDVWQGVCRAGGGHQGRAGGRRACCSRGGERRRKPRQSGGRAEGIVACKDLVCCTVAAGWAWAASGGSAAEK